MFYKSFKSLGWLALFALFVFLSCNKDDDKPQPQPKPTEEYSITVGDEGFQVGKVLDSFMVASEYRNIISNSSSTTRESSVTIQIYGQENNNILQITAVNPYKTTNIENSGIEEKNYTRKGDECIQESNTETCDRFQFSYTKNEGNGTTILYNSSPTSAYGSMEVIRFDTNDQRVTAVFEGMAYTIDESDSISIKGKAIFVPFEMD
ncbi:MAG: hypothetical protein RI562_09240 [Salibacter sp.]|uniref:hypothetical protein n=1 Tax=Salibacter sp. TaxID=2010995 RepID=UPI00286FCE37|nr:hypothetical protein [Salibacter sp.]MDR9399235.1 hypothetical protein [Salibacter sp.]